MSNVSSGQTHLMEILTEILPSGEKFLYEHHVGKRLRLDIYIPRLEVGVEYHGEQHFQYSDHFHKTNQGYLKAIERDFQKIESCKSLGIGLIIFSCKEEINRDIVYDRLMAAIANPTEIKAEPSYEEKMRQRAREYKRERYSELKQRRKERDRQ